MAGTRRVKPICPPPPSARTGAPAGGGVLGSHRLETISGAGPDSYRAIFYLAGPLMLSSTGYMLMQFADHLERRILRSIGKPGDAVLTFLRAVGPSEIVRIAEVGNSVDQIGGLFFIDVENDEQSLKQLAPRFVQVDLAALVLNRHRDHPLAEWERGSWRGPFSALQIPLAVASAQIPSW